MLEDVKWCRDDSESNQPTTAPLPSVPTGHWPCRTVKLTRIKSLIALTHAAIASKQPRLANKEDFFLRMHMCLLKESCSPAQECASAGAVDVSSAVGVRQQARVLRGVKVLTS